jgi:phage terminase small subunit
MTTLSLSARETRFVREYLVDACGTQAAIRAGVAPAGAHVWASRALRKAKVSAALHARQTADAARLSIQREDVLNGLVEAAAMAKLQCDPAGMVAAWKQVGHLMGYYSPERIKVDVDVNVAGNVEMDRLNQLSDAELLKIIEAGRAAQPEQRDFAPAAA